MADPAPEHALNLLGLKKSSRVQTVGNALSALRTFVSREGMRVDFRTDAEIDL